MLEFVKAVNEWMWGLILLIILCGTGIFFTIRLKFIQVRKFGEGCRLVFGHFKSSGGERKEGEMTPFQSLATAIAAQVGTGNLTGAATALIAGGPGAIFWMWISAFFGMATIYGEATLAQEYKTKKDGEVTAYHRYHVELGEISSYPPGYKENAGIFCHNNPWISIAETIIGRGNRAWQVYTRTCPAYIEDISEIHRTEPYVYSQMIAGKDAPNFGEAKNSWLTGTAACLYGT